MFAHYDLSEFQIALVVGSDCTNVVVVAVFTIAFQAMQMTISVAPVTLFVIAAFATLNITVAMTFAAFFCVMVFTV